VGKTKAHWQEIRKVVIEFCGVGIIRRFFRAPGVVCGTGGNVTDAVS
jgi:hypothetical protein